MIGSKACRARRLVDPARPDPWRAAARGSGRSWSGFRRRVRCRHTVAPRVRLQRHAASRAFEPRDRQFVAADDECPWSRAVRRARQRPTRSEAPPRGRRAPAAGHRPQPRPRSSRREGGAQPRAVETRFRSRARIRSTKFWLVVSDRGSARPARRQRRGDRFPRRSATASTASGRLRSCAMASTRVPFEARSLSE